MTSAKLVSRCMGVSEISIGYRAMALEASPQYLWDPHPETAMTSSCHADHLSRSLCDALQVFSPSLFLEVPGTQLEARVMLQSPWVSSHTLICKGGKDLYTEHFAALERDFAASFSSGGSGLEPQWLV